MDGIGRRNSLLREVLSQSARGSTLSQAPGSRYEGHFVSSARAAAASDFAAAVAFAFALPCSLNEEPVMSTILGSGTTPGVRSLGTPSSRPAPPHPDNPRERTIT